MPVLNFQPQGLDETVKGVDRLRNALSGVKNEAKGVNAAGVGGGAEFVKQSTAYNQRIAALAGFTGNFDSELGQMLQTLADAGDVAEGASQSLTSLKGAGLAAGIAVGALVLAFVAIQKIAEENRKVQEKYIQALDNYGKRERAIRNYALQISDEYLASEQARLESERQILQAQIANNDLAIKSTNEALGKYGGLVKGFGDVLGVDTDEAEKNLDDLKNQLKQVNDATEALTSEEVKHALAIRETISAMQTEYDLRVQLVEQIDNLTTAQVEQIIQTKERIRAIKEEERAELARDLQGGASLEQVAAVTGLDMETIIKGLRGQTGDLATAFREVDDEVKALTQELEFYTQTAKPAVAEAEATRTALDNVTKAQADYKEVLKSTEEQLADITAKRLSIEQQIAESRVKENGQELRDYITNTIEGRIAEAKAIEEQQAREEELTRIREQSSHTIIKIQSDLNKGLAELERDFYKNRSEFIQDYYASSLEALQSYQIEESRRTEDYNRQRLREIQDLYGNLSDAALDNDIKRFISIQKEGEKSLQRSAEDQDVETRRRAEDYARQSAQARAQFEQQLAEMQEQYEIERQTRALAAQQRILEIQEQTRREIELQRQAGQIKLSESQRLEQQLNNLRNQWRQADEQQARQLRLQFMQNEINDIIAQENAIRQIRYQSTIALAQSLAQYGASSIPTRSTSSTPIQINMGGVNVGEITTPTQVNQVVTQMAEAINRAVNNLPMILGG